MLANRDTLQRKTTRIHQLRIFLFKFLHWAKTYENERKENTVTNWARALVRPTFLENIEHLVSDGTSNGLKVSRQFQFTHGNLNLLTATSIYLRQFQFYSRQFQFVHRNFNFILTAISMSIRKFCTMMTITITISLSTLKRKLKHYKLHRNKVDYPQF